MINTLDSQAKTTPLDIAVMSARYLVDSGGSKTDVVLPFSVWESLLVWLEDVEDRALVREWSPQLRMGPVKSGTLRWADVAVEWDDEPTL